MARDCCRPCPRPRSKSGYRSRSRSKSRSRTRYTKYRSKRTQSPEPRTHLEETRSLTTSPTEQYGNEMADSAARTLNCMSGILEKATSATSNYFIRQEHDSRWTYAFRVLMGVLLFVAMYFIIRNKQVQEMLGAPWNTAMHQIYMNPGSIPGKHGH